MNGVTLEVIVEQKKLNKISLNQWSNAWRRENFWKKKEIIEIKNISVKLVKKMEKKIFAFIQPMLV